MSWLTTETNYYWFTHRSTNSFEGSALKNEMKSSLFKQISSALLADDADNEFTQQFSTFQSTVEKVDFMSNILETHKFFPEFIEDIKNNIKSEELRIRGNLFYTQMEDEDALKSYTLSIANAVFSTEDLGLAYANRSAVLFRLKLFKECLEDIQRALLNNYPENLKPKLLKRQKNAEILKSKQQKIPYHQPIPKIPEEHRNATIECASDSVEIKNDPTFGRHIIATRDIEIGEIIAVEQAAFTVLTGNSWCHCHHCLTLCYCLIPCKSCTKALFCSDVCRNNAKKYHDFECRILATVDYFDFEPCPLLPFRMAILMKDEYHNLFNDVKEKENLYLSGRYREIHNLLTNEKLKTNSSKLLLVIVASLFYNLLKNHTKFFEKLDNNSENIFKRFVLHNLCTITNFYSIEDLEWFPELDAYQQHPIGMGAYGFLSLFNHSCAPNTARVHYGTNIALYVTESVRKGEQLFENYGLDYGMDPKYERQPFLKKRYFFDCRCRACENNWGTEDTLPTPEGKKIMHLYELASATHIADLNKIRKIQREWRRAVLKLQKKAPCREYFWIQKYFQQSLGVFGNIRRTF